MAMEFENKITIGNLITIGVTVATIIWGYATLQGEQARQMDKIASIEGTIRERISIAETRNSGMEARMRSVEIGYAGMSSDLRNALIGINDIKAALEKGKP